MALAKLAALAALGYGVASVSAQCLQLTGSRMCPSFQDQYINPSNLSTSWPFFAGVTDVASFDSSFAQYIVNPPEFPRTKFFRQLGCQNFDQPFVLQWTQTFLCGEFTQISYSAGCYPSGAVRRMTCQSTCLEFAGDEINLVKNTTVCPGPDTTNGARQGNMTKDFLSCTDWTSLATNNTATCVEGAVNEPNCGFGQNTARLCGHCNPAGGKDVTACCLSNNTDISTCGFTLSPSQISSISSPSGGPTSVPSSVIASSMSSLISVASSSIAGVSGPYNNINHSGLSGGAIAGIVIGSVVGGLILLALLIFLILFMRRRSNAAAQRIESEGAGGGSGGLWGAGPAGAAAGAGAAAAGAGKREKSFDEKPLKGSPSIAGSGATTIPGSDGVSVSHSRNLSAGGLSGTGGFLGGALAGLGVGAAAGAGAASGTGSARQSEERPISGQTGVSAATGNTGATGSGSSNEGRNLVSSYRDQYSQTEITPGTQVMAIYPYSPNLPDELRLEPDTIVTIQKIFDDGWAVGSVSRGDADGGPREGAFPLVVTCALSFANDSESVTSSSRGAVTADESASASRRGSLYGEGDTSERTSSFNSATSHLAGQTPDREGDPSGSNAGFFSGIMGGRR